MDKTKGSVDKHKCSSDCMFCEPKIEKHSLDISQLNQLEIHITKYTNLNINHGKHKMTLTITPDATGTGVITHTGGIGE